MPIRSCKENKVLFLADCINPAGGERAKMFACDWENVTPDMYILAKAMGGGFSISAIVADESVMGVLKPGDHGSTFGGNSFCSAVHWKRSKW